MNSTRVNLWDLQFSGVPRCSRRLPCIRISQLSEGHPRLAGTHSRHPMKFWVTSRHCHSFRNLSRGLVPSHYNQSSLVTSQVQTLLSPPSFLPHVAYLT